ncbi:hypothetical protein GCM10010273_33110 [Streptomyces lavendulocolor]
MRAYEDAARPPATSRDLSRRTSAPTPAPDVRADPAPTLRRTPAPDARADLRADPAPDPRVDPAPTFASTPHRRPRRPRAVSEPAVSGVVAVRPAVARRTPRTAVRAASAPDPRAAPVRPAAGRETALVGGGAATRPPAR